MAAASSPAPSSPGTAVHGALVAINVAFASLSVAGKVVLRTLEPGSLALVRLGGAAAVFAAVLAARRERLAIPRRDLLAIAGCACLGIFGNQVLFLHGLRLTSPVNATVLVATIPVFTVLVAIVLGREPARLGTLTGVAVALAGVLYLLGADALELFSVSRGSDALVGDLLVLANSVSYALYLVLVRDLVALHGSLPVVAIGFGVGTLLALPIGAPPLLADAAEIDARIGGLLLYVVLVPTVFTYLANAWALRRASSSLVAIYIYAQPTFAAFFAWLFLDELPSARVVVAVLAVFSGIWLVTRAPAAPEARPAEAGR